MLLVNPQGRIGLSAAFEIGYAKSIAKPIYALCRPDDATLQHYIDRIIELDRLHVVTDQKSVVSDYHLFFDADDTLWDDQGKLQKTEREAEAFVDKLLGKSSAFQKKFIDIEHENIPIIGFGFHSYFFSMAEAFFREPHTVTAKNEFLKVIAALIESYLHAPPDLFPGVKDTLTELRNLGFRLHLVTRGIRNEQIEKLNKSGLTDLFDTIHVVGKKDSQLYANLMTELGTDGAHSCMIGNSIKIRYQTLFKKRYGMRISSDPKSVGFR